MYYLYLSRETLYTGKRIVYIGVHARRGDYLDTQRPEFKVGFTKKYKCYFMI